MSARVDVSVQELNGTGRMKVVFKMGRDMVIYFEKDCPINGVSVTEYKNYCEMSPIDCYGYIDYNNNINFTYPQYFTDIAELQNEIIRLAYMSDRATV